MLARFYAKWVLAMVLLCCGSAIALPQGPYMGQEPPGLVPEIFAPGFISMPGRFERTPNFSPDGNEFYFTVILPDHTDQDIYYSVVDANGEWSSPQEIYFSVGKISSDVSLTSDGNRLCFTSNEGKSYFWDNDIWVSERVGGWWAAPTLLSPVLTTYYGEWGPCLLANGTVYFARTISGSNSELYRSRFIGGVYETPVLVPVVNSSYFEYDQIVDDDKSYMIFKSNRPGGYGATDLYGSLDDGGTWTAPKNLGPIMNTVNSDDCGNLTPDGKYFMFARRQGDIEMDIYWVDVRAVLPEPNGPIKNTTSGLQFGSIQCAISYANNGEEIVLSPGTYEENIDLTGKNLTIRSYDPNDCVVVAETIIKGINPNSATVAFANSEDSNCVLAGLTITGGGPDANAGVLCSGSNSSPVIKNCIITGNSGAGIHCDQSEPTISNCTIVGNKSYGIYSDNSDAIITSCIIRSNLGDSIYSIGSVNSTHNCIEGGYSGIGNIEVDPCFAQPGNWDTNGTPSDANDDFWVAGDYHLKSVRGRWDPNLSSWVTDSVTSRCIDAGNPEYTLADEVNDVNNLRINMGVYGGTCEASKSIEGWSLLSDINNDGVSDFKNFNAFSSGWRDTKERYSDLDRNGEVDYLDVKLLVEDWLKETNWH